MAPRLYSIASSLKAHPEEVHLTIAAVRYDTNGKERVGVASTYIADLVPHGVRFFAHGAGFLHQKVVLIDDTFAAVGTSNFDPRSLIINFEVDVGLLDPSSIGEVAAMLERDLANCHEIDDSVYLKRAFAYRLACRAARLFSPLL